MTVEVWGCATGDTPCDEPQGLSRPSSPGGLLFQVAVLGPAVHVASSSIPSPSHHSNKPEQEQRLLSALVNKLGDPDRKLASKVGFLLSRLLTEHPMMKVVVVREVERFMFRPGLQDRWV